MSSKKYWFALVICLVLVSPAYATVWIYQVDPVVCNGCGRCIPYCSTGALHMSGPNAVIDPELCNGCGDCVPHCIRGAIYQYWYTGITENDDPVSVTLGPSPTEGLLLVSGAGEGEPITVLDLSGRLLLSETASVDGSALLDLSRLPPGSYIVTVGFSLLRTIALIR
jgi:ferredoxin